MAGCKLEDCKLADDVAEIKRDQKETKEDVSEIKTGQAVMSQKLDDYMDRGKEEHGALFKRSSGTVKWIHLYAALVAIGIIIGIAYKFLT